MATIKQIQFKRSNVAGKRPLPADIAEGELAINIKDSTLFTKNADGQIIDLGFAKGGKIDGDVTQVGNYTTSGDISAKTFLASAGVSSNGDIVAERGVIRTRAAASGNAHLWFEGEEVTGENRNKERGVLYAAQQTDTDGRVNLRVYNGKSHAANTNNALFVFNGAGDFAAPRDLYAQRSRLSNESIAPTMNTSRLYTRNRAFNEFGTNQSYGWDDTVNYTAGQSGAIALNYVYKGRAHASGTIWHQLIDERDGADWAIYTGSGAERKMFNIRSAGSLGHAQFTGSLFLGSGGGGLGVISGMGEGSLALGDNDTGLRNDGAGAFSVMANSRELINYNSSAVKYQIEHRKATRITHTDNANTPILPTNNNPLLEIDTSLDSNNSGGNGLTLLGYNSGGKYYHYFRGNGNAVFDMSLGVSINKGGLNVNGNSEFSGTLSAPRFDALGDISFKNTVNRHIRFEYTNSSGATAVDGYIFKDGPSNTSRRPGIRVNCTAPNSSSGSGDFVFGEDGHFTVPRQVQPGDFGNFDSRYQNLFQLGANVNLDTLTGDSQIGEYAQHANANTSLALNYPEAQAGHLTITSGAGVQQTYRVYNSSRMYLRSKYSTSPWTPWDRVVTDDYLASGIGGSIVSKAADGFRIAYGNYGFFIRNDGGTTYFLLTNSDDSMGTWNGLRPLTINNGTGQVSIGTPLVVTHSSGLTVTSTAGDAISWGSLGACLANDGNLKGSRWKSFGGSDWAGDALNWVNNNNVAKAGDTMSGTLTMGNGQITLSGGNGNINFLKAGTNPRNMRIFIAGDTSRGNRIELADDSSYLVYFERHPTSGVQLMMNGNGNFYNVYIRSDIRLKRNLKKIENAVDKVDKLNGYIYEKTDKIGGTEFKVEAGIIAQELKEVLPEAVEAVSMDNGEETLTVSSAATIALLVNAIKELKARVEYLESK